MVSFLGWAEMYEHAYLQQDFDSAAPCIEQGKKEMLPLHSGITNTGPRLRFDGNAPPFRNVGVGDVAEDGDLVVSVN